MLPIKYLGTALRDLQNFPIDARKRTGFALQAVSEEIMSADWRPVPSIGSNTREIRIHVQGEFQILYIALFQEAAYVLHGYQKVNKRASEKAEQIALGRYQQQWGGDAHDPNYKLDKIHSCGDVFVDMGFDDSEAVKLGIISTLMLSIREEVTRQAWSLDESAHAANVKEARINDVLRGKIDKLSMDLLTDMVVSIGGEPKVTVAFSKYRSPIYNV